ncbi:hypothetical protein [Nocardia callitridis]|uniref:Serine hydrolase n=1 Tax=Nocardia callitridis TaxID=648753 RepID=A0ABP9JRG3_9NOCA
MGKRSTVIVGACFALALAFPFSTAHAAPDIPPPVPPRTAIALRSPVLQWGTPNEHERRSGLSLTKLYVVDYALRHGDHSAADRDLSERMISYSDDGAATELDSKYPQAIDAVAAEYHLTETGRGAEWGTATTSAADVSDFLAAKQRTDPESPILRWMADAGATAADGTAQDWGTARLPSVRGTKWGWSDAGEPEVASASYGPGFAVTAHTRGTADEQTADVMDALAEVIAVLFPR